MILQTAVKLEAGISANEVVIDDGIAEVIARKDQLCRALQEISLLDAQQIIPHYFFKRCSSGMFGPEKEALEFSASILALLQQGVTPTKIIATNLPLNFFVANATQMGPVVKAYKILESLSNSDAINDELKKSIEEYLKCIQTAGSMFFRKDNAFSWCLNGEGIPGKKEDNQFASYLYEEVFNSPPAALNPSSGKALAKLHLIDFEYNPAAQKTDALFLLAKHCLSNPLPEEDERQKPVGNIVVTAENFSLLPLFLEEHALRYYYIVPILSAMIDFYYKNPQPHLSHPFSKEWVPEPMALT